MKAMRVISPASAGTFAPPRRGRKHVRFLRSRRARSVAGVISICLILAGLATTFAAQQASRRPQPATGTIIWGGRIFSSRSDLRGWLVSRGSSYRQWASKHPVAAIGQQRPVAFSGQHLNGAQRLAVVIRALLITLLAVVLYLMLPLRLTFRRFARSRISE
jgi:hypothetical protein